MICYLKHINFVSWHKEEIIIHSQQGQKGHVNPCSTEKVPHIVVIIKVQKAAIRVQIPGFSRGQVPVGRPHRIKEARNDAKNDGQHCKKAARREKRGYFAAFEFDPVSLVNVLGLGVLCAVFSDDVVEQIEEQVPRQNVEDHVGDILVGLLNFCVGNVNGVGKVDNAENDGENEPLGELDALQLDFAREPAKPAIGFIGDLDRSDGFPVAKNVHGEGQDHFPVHPSDADVVAVECDEQGHVSVRRQKYTIYDP